MRKLTLRSLWEHKRRLISTIIAIVLGVAFMSGTSVITGTIDKVFDDMFADANEEVDAQIQGPVTFEDPFFGDVRGRIDATLATQVATVDGVASVAPYIATQGGGANNIVLGRYGQPLGTAGPPTLLESWVVDPVLNPYDLASGRGPQADNEMAIDVNSAEEGELFLGDQVRVLSQHGPSTYTLVGTLTFDGEDTLGGVVSANFTLPEAQRLAGVTGEVDTILAHASDGVTPAELVERIRPVIPEPDEVITGEEAAAQGSDQVQQSFSFFQTLLTIFGVIALIVGAFIITNTFAILLAQRTRELALLRAIGASKGQVLRSVLLEALVIGVVASILGLLGGILLATGATSLMSGGDSDFQPTLVVGPQTVVSAIAIGLILTVISAVIPAWRSTRVPPLAAIREVAIDRSGASRARAVLGAVIVLLGVVNLVQAYTTDSSETPIITVGLGALLLLAGAIIVGPVVAAPTVRLLGSVLPRFRGITGRLAVENAARSPKRTSATAAALIIAVGLVGFITVFAASAEASVTEQVDRGLKADLVVQPESAFGSGGGFGGLPGGVADAVRQVPGVAVATGLGFAQGEVTYPDGDESGTYLSSADPVALAEVVEPKMVEGALADLTEGTVIVDTAIAERNDLGVGDQVSVSVPQGGAIELTISAISADANVLGYWTMTETDFDSISSQVAQQYLYVGLADGADLATVQSQAQQAVNAVGPRIEVLDRDQFRDSIVEQFTQLLQLVYGLLLVSIVIAFVGIANTLALSIYERTRELGLLRAVGMVRGQLRSAIRWEAALISVLGTLVGLALALVISRSIVQALRSQGLGTFQVPIGWLAFIVIAAAGLGVLASVLPGRRASRMQVLDAIARD